MDGTLIDTERLWVEAAFNVLRRKGHSIRHDEAVALVYGRGWHDIYDDIHRDYPGAFADLEGASAELGEEMDALKSRCDVRIHSSIALLKRLAADYPVAVVSGSTRDYILEGLKLAGVEEDVRLVVGCEDYERGKPDPAPFLEAAQRLGVLPSECLVFEDSRAGVLAAKAAGMRVVGLQREVAPPQDLSPADQVLSDLAAFRP